MIEAPVIGDRTSEAPVEPVDGIQVETPSSDAADRRRFAKSVALGAAVTIPFYLWVLWDLWSGTVNPLRSQAPDNFYDLQARAMFHGHLWVPNQSLGIEGFIHAGHEYTYFGIFPSLIRMPFLLVTSHFDGQYTGPSLISAFLLTGLFTALLLWRLRILVRGGHAALGRPEATAYAFFMAAIMGGSVLVFLAANPSIYNEDFAWSVALTVGSLFALLGVLERPTGWRVLASGSLVLAANLNRSPTGYACAIAAFLVAAWFALGRGGRDNRRWAIPVGLAGLIPLLASCAVTYAKFGLPFGLPMADQVWTQINAHRRAFLAANGGKAFGLGFLPSTLTAYLDPANLRFSTLFPFITLPPTPAHAVGHVVLDQTYVTTSVPASMPLLFLAGLWGMVTAFRPRPLGQLRLTRVLLVAAMAATAGVLVWGYIADRYLADLLPLLILAGCIGMVDLSRRAEQATRPWRTAFLVAVGALALFGIVVNMAITAEPSTWFSEAQTLSFVSRQDALTPGALAATVTTGSRMPYYAPAGTLFIADGCSGLYRSNGDSFANSPGQQIDHSTWTPVERASDLTQTLTFTFHRVGWTGPDIPLLHYGRTTVVLRSAGPAEAKIVVQNPGDPSVTWPSSAGYNFPQILHGVYHISVVTDPNLQSIEVHWYGELMVNRFLATNGSTKAVVAVTPPAVAATDPTISVAALPQPKSNMALCQSLLAAHDAASTGSTP